MTLLLISSFRIKFTCHGDLQKNSVLIAIAALFLLYMRVKMTFCLGKHKILVKFKLSTNSIFSLISGETAWEIQMWYGVSSSSTDTWKNGVAGDETLSSPKTPTETTSRRRSYILPSLMVCSPSPSCLSWWAISQVAFASRLPSSCSRKPCRAKQHLASWALVVGSLASPGFLPCSWWSCVVTRTSVKSLRHLGSPMASEGCAPAAGFSLLGCFTFCLGCWVSCHHLLCYSTSDRAKHSCITPEKHLCHLFLTTPLPSGVPQYPKLIAWCVTVYRVRMVFQMPSLWFSCHNLSSLILFLSLVEMAKSCFFTLLLPFSLFESGYLFTSVFSKFKQT